MSMGWTPSAIGSIATPPVDGRQSVAALRIRRGVGRLLRALEFSLVPEVTLASGRRADLVAICPRGSVVIVEIKSSIEDFRADCKWPEYRLHCDRLYFATAPEVPPEIFPPDEGLIVSDGFDAEIVRESPEARLPAATRKAVLLRFAHAAARRLHDLEDPSLRRGEPTIV